VQGNDGYLCLLELQTRCICKKVQLFILLDLQRAVLASTTGRSVPRESRVVRFHVNGYDITTSEATTRWIPGSYIDWLVSNCEDEVAQGLPIVLRTSPKYFSRLLRRLSMMHERKIRSGAVPASRLAKRRRQAMDPPPFTTKRMFVPDGKRTQICRISTPLPTDDASIHSTALDAVEAIMESLKILWDTSETYFDRLVVLLTMGKTLSGTPLIWPYLYHLFDSHSSAVSELSLVENEEISEMDEGELEELYQSVDISPELQHQVKVNMRFKGYSCMFSDMKLDLNNFLHWRIARVTDNGIRPLDDALTARCLIVNL